MTLQVHDFGLQSLGITQHYALDEMEPKFDGAPGGTWSDLG